MTILKSYIDSKFWRGTKTPDQINQMLVANKLSGKPNYIPMGRLWGEGVSFEETPNTNATGDMKDKGPSILILGRFKGICYETCEHREAVGVYLPSYFRKMIQGQLQRNPGDSAAFAVEIGVQLTGRSIPWAWCVVTILKDEETAKMAALESRMIEQGVGLFTQPAIEHEKPKGKAA